MTEENSNTSEVEPRQGWAVWGIWGTLLWGGLIALVFIISQTVAAIIYLAIDQQWTDPNQFQNFESFADDGDVLSICTLASFILCTLLIMLAVASKRGAKLTHYLALQRIGWRYYLLGIIVLVVLLLGVELLNVVLGRQSLPDVMKQMYLSADRKLMLWLAIVVLAPIFEEVFFRGFLYRGFSQGDRSNDIVKVGAAIIITAAAWAVIHLQYEAFEVTVIFFMGLVLGLARWITGSIYVPIAMHAVNNFISMVQVAYITNTEAFPSISLPLLSH